ncbi:AzlD domain-containing protein [Sporolactobacillus laevolacticus]|uniref:Branched-chain amino acid transport n=1 Tax=Sporolactobacillus laevolacticus DSM 442 TaxID=1395513 RepID=V6J042_9BACL|nr:AzlD domain-containing protein [Sporolactobacillus laevolacticus]EST12521.1 branched-chain amino acid transport [Sporolactobacillus laevolacticus DSM 442]MDN3954551.1 AzlD domain-containing protein [Sporolactobacillus laevolacticus]
MLNQWLLIGILAISTYLSRLIGVVFMARQKMSPSLRLYFNYVPIAIIAALLVKQIFVPTDGQLTISLPVLIGCISTAVAIKITRLFLPSVVIGIVVGLLVRYFLI